MTDIIHPSWWWRKNNPTPKLEEVCIEEETGRIKYGDGISDYNDLCYSGYRLVDDHTVVDECFETKYKDTAIDGNECIIKDRILKENSTTIKDFIK